jgi:hypothetical protein
VLCSHMIRKYQWLNERDEWSPLPRKFELTWQGTLPAPVSTKNTINEANPK